MAVEFRNCEATILHNAFPHNGWPAAELLFTSMLWICFKLSAPATHYLLAHDVRPIDVAQLTMSFHRHNALCIQKLHHKIALHSRREFE